MNIKSDQLCCYLEGIKVPIKEFKVSYNRNKLAQCNIIIPIGEVIIPKMWANAFVQVTYIDSEANTRKEKLLFQGLCVNLTIIENNGLMNIKAVSVWDSFNLNSTMDYISPKKYGLHNIDEGLLIYLGTEQTIFPELASMPGYKLSWRYFWIDNETVNVDDIDWNDPDAMKIQFIASRIPNAERFAYSFFENISYGNFLLSRAYAERFNLLSKSKRDAEREINYISKNIVGITKPRPEEVNLPAHYYNKYSIKDGKISTTSDGQIVSADDSQMIKNDGRNTSGDFTNIALQVKEDVDKKFGTNGTTYSKHGYPSKTDPYHYKRCIDFAVKDKKMGDELSAYIGHNWANFHGYYMIWWNRDTLDGVNWRDNYYEKKAKKNGEPDTPTWRHKDHVHFEVVKE